jgi:HD superfamily phosphodiesterase
VTEDVLERIYALAEPYWRTRAGEVHMPESYAYARELLEAHPEADAGIVLPAILLHDVGYALVPDETHTQGLADGKNGWQPDVTRMHEQLGASLAGELLEQAGYDGDDRIARIQAIVDGHDTRTEPLDLEDALVKDADKLWRFSPSAAAICPAWFDTTPPEYLDWIESRLDEWLLTDPGRARARELLAASRAAVASG